jgi:hypothetical protein
MISIFMGAHTLWEIPFLLERDGFIDEEETSALYSMTDSERAIRIMKAYVQRAYFEYWGRSKFLN